MTELEKKLLLTEDEYDYLMEHLGYESPVLCVDMFIGLVCRACILLQKRPNCCPLGSARF